MTQIDVACKMGVCGLGYASATVTTVFCYTCVLSKVLRDTLVVQPPMCIEEVLMF